MGHAPWCATPDHEDRTAAASQAHPGNPEWTGCCSPVRQLSLHDGVTLTGSLIETRPEHVEVIVEAARGGRLAPTLQMTPADLAVASAWGAELAAAAGTTCGASAS